MMMDVKQWLTAGIVVVSILLLIYSCTKRMDLNAEDYFDGPARQLATALQENHYQQAQSLLTSVDINKIYRQHMTFIMWCIANANPQALRWVLDHGANPNYQDEQGTSPVAYTAMGSRQDYLKILLEHGGDPNSRNEQRPAVMEAALQDQWPNVVYLLDHGADINAVDERGQNLLITYAGLQYFDKVAYLIDRGADIFHKTKNGSWVASRIQSSNPNPGTENYKWQQIVRQKLMEKGVRFPVPNPWEERQQQQGKNE